MIAKFVNFFNFINTLYQESPSFDKTDFRVYQDKLIHQWMRILYFVAILTNISYGLRDFAMFDGPVFHQFLLFRITTTCITILIFFFIVKTDPSRYSFVFGYILSMITALAAAQMTVELGGFNSGNYAGMNIVIIGVNLFLPWKYFHSAINSLLVILIYITVNLLNPQDYQTEILINNIYFLFSTATATVIVSYFQLGHIQSEYILRQDLQNFKETLQSEMELAKRIQISLLPQLQQTREYEIASIMLPADLVGGDYFDVIETDNETDWVAMGDVSGHGVDSGLAMMMAHTAIASTISSSRSALPSDILLNVNRVLLTSIERMNMERYMTLVLMKMQKDKVTFSGRHMDILIYRKKTGTVEVISEKGIYLGVFEYNPRDMKNHEFCTESGDMILLFTDGITEAFDASDQMYGQERLVELFTKNAAKTPTEIINSLIEDVFVFQKEQKDDISLMVLRKK